MREGVALGCCEVGWFVLEAPSLDEDLGLVEVGENLAAQQLLSKLAVEALAVAVLSRASQFDEQGANGQPIQPLSCSLRAEPWPYSERMSSGFPLSANGSANVMITSCATRLVAASCLIPP